MNCSIADTCNSVCRWDQDSKLKIPMFTGFTSRVSMTIYAGGQSPTQRSYRSTDANHNAAVPRHCEDVDLGQENTQDRWDSHHGSCQGRWNQPRSCQLRAPLVEELNTEIEDLNTEKSCWFTRRRRFRAIWFDKGRTQLKWIGIQYLRHRVAVVSSSIREALEESADIRTQFFPSLCSRTIVSNANEGNTTEPLVRTSDTECIKQCENLMRLSSHWSFPKKMIFNSLNTAAQILTSEFVSEWCKHVRMSRSEECEDSFPVVVMCLTVFSFRWDCQTIWKQMELLNTTIFRREHQPRADSILDSVVSDRNVADTITALPADLVVMSDKRGEVKIMKDSLEWHWKDHDPQRQRRSQHSFWAFGVQRLGYGGQEGLRSNFLYQTSSSVRLSFKDVIRKSKTFETVMCLSVFMSPLGQTTLHFAPSWRIADKHDSSWWIVRSRDK